MVCGGGFTGGGGGEGDGECGLWLALERGLVEVGGRSDLAPAEAGWADDGEAGSFDGDSELGCVRELGE